MIGAVTDILQTRLNNENDITINCQTILNKFKILTNSKHLYIACKRVRNSEFNIICIQDTIPRVFETLEIGQVEHVVTLSKKLCKIDLTFGESCIGYIVFKNTTKKTCSEWKSELELIIIASSNIVFSCQQSQELKEAHDIFIATLSHEMRTPLNGIVGAIQLLQKLPKLPEHKEYLDIINTCGFQMVEIINDLLDYSRIDAGKLILTNESFDLRILVECVYNITHLKAFEKNLEFKYFIHHKCPQYVLGDKKRLKQVLINLVINAIKYTISGQVLLNVECDTNSLYFFIQDTGCGIDSTDFTRIFNPFVKLETIQSEGVGLGLWICKQLVTLMNGTINIVSSTKSSGTLIKVEIPLIVCKPILKYKNILIIDSNVHRRLKLFNTLLELDCRPVVHEYYNKDLVADYSVELVFSSENLETNIPQILIDFENVPPVTELGNLINEHSKSLKIKNVAFLIVDDFYYNVKILKDFLQSFGYTHVDGVTNGKDAIKKFLEFRHSIIFMDLRMPLMDGFETTRLIFNECTSLKKPIIVPTTAYISEEEKRKCKECGMTSFIPKPLNERLLLQFLNTLSY